MSGRANIRKANVEVAIVRGANGLIPMYAMSCVQCHVCTVQCPIMWLVVFFRFDFVVLKKLIINVHITFII